MAFANSNTPPANSTDNPEYENSYVERGRILPVKHGTLPRARCGECGRMFQMHPAAHNIHDELEHTAKWKYTLVNGWVCNDCFPLPRLPQGAPNRASPDEHCLMRSPRGMIVAVRIAATDAILNLARRGWTFVEFVETDEVQR